jgi:hypothetical protein
VQKRRFSTYIRKAHANRSLFAHLDDFSVKSPDG